MCASTYGLRNRIELSRRFIWVTFLAGLPSVVFEICCGIVVLLKHSDGFASADQACNWWRGGGVQVGAMHPLGICKI